MLPSYNMPPGFMSPQQRIAFSYQSGPYAATFQGLTRQMAAQSLMGSGQLMGFANQWDIGNTLNGSVLNGLIQGLDAQNRKHLGLDVYKGPGVGPTRDLYVTSMDSFGAIISNLVNPQAVAQRYQYQTHLPSFMPGMTPQQTQSLQINSLFPGGSFQGHMMPGSYGLQGVFANLGILGMNPFHY